MFADVAILGGGPAGCASALSLASHAPGLSVVIVEASSYDRARMGETLIPVARGLLEHLGVWEAFVAQNHDELHGTTASWGSATSRGNDYLFSAYGPGWHLDRRAFDELLAREAERRGTMVLRDTRFSDALEEDGAWRLRLSDSSLLSCRFVVDATGSTASFARLRGARPVAEDRLVGFARWFDEGDGGEPGTLVEAVADGWWHTATLPNGKRVATCMTDPDVARALQLHRPAGWARALRSTHRVGPIVGAARPSGPVIVRSARSRRTAPATGEGWLAAGDAASSFDPLSSAGIVKSLRSGIFASYALSEWLAGGSAGGLDRYEAYIDDEFESYSKTRRRYYATEQRWPESVFWRRRQGAGV